MFTCKCIDAYAAKATHIVSIVATSLFDIPLVMVINFIYVSLCKGHVKIYDVIIVNFSHVWTIVVKSNVRIFRYIRNS